MVLSILLLMFSAGANLMFSRLAEQKTTIQYWHVKLLDAQIEDTVVLTFTESDPGVFYVAEKMLSEPGYIAKSTLIQMPGRGWYLSSAANEPCQSLLLEDPRICRVIDSLPAQIFAYSLVGMIPNTSGIFGTPLSDSTSCANLRVFTNSRRCVCYVSKDSVTNLPVHSYGCGEKMMGGGVVYDTISFDSTFVGNSRNVRRVSFGSYSTGAQFWGYMDWPYTVSRLLEAKRIENPYPNGISPFRGRNKQVQRNGRVFASMERLEEWCDANDVEVDQLRTLDQGRSSKGDSRNLLLLGKGGEKFRILLLR